MAGNSETRPVTVAAIMRSKAFRAGFADARAGMVYGVDSRPSDQQWGYERGWLFARRYPDINQLGDRALRLLDKGFKKGEIL